MPPIDPTPQGGEVTRERDEPQFPQRVPAAQGDGADRPQADADRDKGDGPEASARIDPITGAGENVAG